jgi:cell division protein FtsI (penicillin-binding protein 3)
LKKEITNTEKDIQKDIRIRARIVYAFVIVFGISILSRILFLQFIEGDMWKEKLAKQNTEIITIEAARGNIFSSDGSLMATSIPVFEVRFEVASINITDEMFNNNIDSLSFCLSTFFKNKTIKEYKRDLIRARKHNSHSFLIAREVNFNELRVIKTFPIFRLGKYKGGFLTLQKNKRIRPFKNLALRTLGYDRISNNPVGIEGSFNNDLKGIGGERLVQKISKNVSIPVNDENEIEPKDGNDIVTTIDIKIQDVAHKALEKQLIAQHADHGCLILMEVKTGEVKAIVNLSRIDSTQYEEIKNYAIGESTEPGSTFKLASLLVALDDKVSTLDEMVETGDGTYNYRGLIIKDSHEGGSGKISLQRVFEESSNVGTAKIITRHYEKNPQKFIDGLNRIGISRKLNLDIPGEKKPYIKNTKDPLWSDFSLPEMSIGYEEQLAPIQILSFYNAVANNGKMMKPQFIKEIKSKGTIIKKFEPIVLQERIASDESILMVRKMLEAVVEKGTATNLRNSYYKIAAKTGTAQIAQDNKGYKNNEGKKSYQASLCGYFPTINPLYSMIIVVTNPSKRAYYGNEVAGPIFREVADKVYSTSTEMHQLISVDTNKVLSRIPFIKNGSNDDINTIAKALTVPLNNKIETEWVYAEENGKTILLNSIPETSKGLPNVIGMGLKDALSILENNKYHVVVNGKGRVKKMYMQQVQHSKKPSVKIELG